MTDLRSEARGRPCMVRLPCCNHDTATTVLAHLRMAGITGAGQKAPDLLGAWACYNCHYVHTTLEFNGEKYERDFVQLAFMEGMARTIYQLIKEGLVSA